MVRHRGGVCWLGSNLLGQHAWRIVAAVIRHEAGPVSLDDMTPEVGMDGPSRGLHARWQTTSS